MSKLSNMTERELLVEVYTKLDTIVEKNKSLDTKVQDVDRRVLKMETRVESNNKFITFIVGVISSCVTLAIKHFTEK